MSITKRPKIVTGEHLEFLDKLRESGKTNKFGARPYLVKAFGLEEGDAGVILRYWMESFSERHSQPEPQ